MIAGAIAIALAARLGVAGANGSNPLAPASLLIVLPSFLLAEWLGDERIGWGIVMLLPAASYLAFSRQLFGGCARIPRRAWVLLGLLVLGSGAWFVASWPYGIRYQGTRFTLSVLGLNLVAALLTSAVGLANRSSPRWASSFAFHTALFGWLAWLSFPWLGEMP